MLFSISEKHDRIIHNFLEPCLQQWYIDMIHNKYWCNIIVTRTYPPPLYHMAGNRAIWLEVHHGNLMESVKVSHGDPSRQPLFCSVCGLLNPTCTIGLAGGSVSFHSHHMCWKSHLTHGNIILGVNPVTPSILGLCYWHGSAWLVFSIQSDHHVKCSTTMPVPVPQRHDRGGNITWSSSSLWMIPSLLILLSKLHLVRSASSLPRQLRGFLCSSTRSSDAYLLYLCGLE